MRIETAVEVDFWTGLKTAPEFALDTETTGLRWSDSLIGVSLAYYDGSQVRKRWIERSGDVLDNHKLVCVLSDETKTIIGHNLGFDLRILWKEVCPVRNQFFDTKIGFSLIDPDGLNGLKALASRVLGQTSVDYTEVLKQHNAKTLLEVPREVVEAYALNDAVWTLQLKSVCEAQLRQKGLYEYFQNIEMPFINIIVEMEQNGMLIDAPLLEQKKQLINSELSTLPAQIYGLAGCEFNINSSQQLGKVLYERHRYGVTKKSKKTGMPSTDYETLSKMQGALPEKILRYKKLHKLASTYLPALTDLRDADGCLRSNFYQFYDISKNKGTITGRLSSQSPNLQNYPSPKKDEFRLRDCFIAHPGRKLIVADESQLELRLLAALSKEPLWVEAFKNNQDLHRITAVAMFNDEGKRDLAKTVTYAMLYGAQAPKIAATAGISVKDADHYLAQHRGLFKTFHAWRDGLITTTERLGYVKTLFGRVIPVPYRLAYKAVDYVAQSLASDIMKLAQVKIQKTSPWLIQCCQIHDEVVVECEESRLQEGAEIVTKCMERPFSDAWLLGDISLAVDVKIVDRWGLAK